MDPAVTSVRDPEPGAPFSYDPDEIQVQKWFVALWRGWGILLAGGVLGAGLGLAAAATTRPTYEAQATLLLAEPPDQTGVFSLPGVRTVLNSPSIANEIVQEFGLSNPPHSLSAQTFLSRAVTIEEIPNTYLVRVRLRLSDPQLAHRVAGRYGDKVVERVEGLWQEGVEARRTRIDRQLDLARTGLAEAEKALVSYRRQSGLNLMLRDVERLFWTRVASVRQGRRSVSELPTATLKGVEDAFAKELELSRLEMEVDVRRSVYADLSRRSEEARVNQTIAAAPMRVVDPPAVPAAPLPGTRSRTVAVGILAGLVLGAAVVIAREWRATR